MASYLAARPENTPETPCSAVLSGVDLSGGLNPLFAAFQGRYVSLDLSGCAFRDIPAEQNIAAREHKDRLVSLILPATLQSIGAYAFYQSSSLATLVLPDSLRSIGDSAFAGCGIEELELPARLQSLGGSAFAASPALRSVSIPPSLAALGDYAFAGCAALVQCLVPDNPPDLAAAVFAGCGESLVFFVPDGASLTLYRSAPSWQLYRPQLAPKTPTPQAFGTCSLITAGGGAPWTMPEASPTRPRSAVPWSSRRCCGA
ncbi:MAG: leucine-rich repeat domain-containing protein [Treponema sp.]|nr:leucine-rich repeat domain-containing protein [Treponema sp.]